MLPLSRKTFVVAVLLIVVVLGAVGAYFGVFRAQQKNDPFLSLASVNVYTQSNFDFSFKGMSTVYPPVSLVCNDKAPKNPTETTLGQYTYCQNNGDPLKVSLAWTKPNIKLNDYLKRIANTVMKDKGQVSAGTYTCIGDKAFPKANALAGVMSDCKVFAPDGNSYYFSAFFFSPPTHPEVGQVIYAYDGKNTPNETVVKRMVRSLAATLVF